MRHPQWSEWVVIVVLLLLLLLDRALFHGFHDWWWWWWWDPCGDRYSSIWVGPSRVQSHTTISPNRVVPTECRSSRLVVVVVVRAVVVVVVRMTRPWY